MVFVENLGHVAVVSSDRKIIGEFTVEHHVTEMSSCHLGDHHEAGEPSTIRYIFIHYYEHQNKIQLK